jgi:hypothetical protein
MQHPRSTHITADALHDQINRITIQQLHNGDSFALNLMLDEIDTVIRHARSLWKWHLDPPTRRAIEHTIAEAEAAFVRTITTGRRLACKPNKCITRQLTLHPFTTDTIGCTLAPCRIIHDFPCNTPLDRRDPHADQYHTGGNPPMKTPPYLRHLPAHAIKRTANTLRRLQGNRRSIVAFVRTTLHIGHTLHRSTVQLGPPARIVASAICWTFAPAFPHSDKVVQAFILQLVRPNENGRALALAFAQMLDNTHDTRQHEIISLHLARLLTLLNMYAAHKQGNRHTYH